MPNGEGYISSIEGYEVKIQQNLYTRSIPSRNASIMRNPNGRRYALYYNATPSYNGHYIGEAYSEQNDAPFKIAYVDSVGGIEGYTHNDGYKVLSEGATVVNMDMAMRNVSSQVHNPDNLMLGNLLLPNYYTVYDNYYLANAEYYRSALQGRLENYSRIILTGDTENVSQYNTERSRFFSEYGFQSFPEYESVKLYAPEKRDHDINSEVMMSHQRGGSFANNRIKEYMLKSYNEPKDFEHFLYVGMILQGDAIKTAMEAHRRDMPYCMGSLFWQHNDCWPVASWASRDYYGRWKAQHYFAKKAYDMILVSPVVLNEKLTVHLVSDYLKAVSGKISLKVMDMKGNVVYDKSMSLKTPVNGSELVFESSINDVLGGKSKNDVIIYTEFETKDKTYTNVAYAAEQKDMNYEKANISWSAKKAEGGYDVTLKSDVFARGVFMSLSGIDNFFEDNYFDLLPGKEVTVNVKTDLSLSVFKDQLKVISLVDSYN